MQIRRFACNVRPCFLGKKERISSTYHRLLNLPRELYVLTAINGRYINCTYTHKSSNFCLSAPKKIKRAFSDQMFHGYSVLLINCDAQKTCIYTDTTTHTQRTCHAHTNTHTRTHTHMFRVAREGPLKTRC